MAKNQTWLVRVDDMEHEVAFTPSFWTGKHIVEIDGEVTRLPATFMQSVITTDHQIFVGNKSCQLVIASGVADIAIDGMYLNSQKPYQPIGKTPIWAWIFVVLCAMHVIGSGVIPATIGMVSATGCLKTAASPTTTTGVKIGLCIGITLLCWVAVFLIVAVVKISLLLME